MKIGAVFPQTEIESDPVIIRDFAQSVEGLGFDHLVAYDHVVGKNTTNVPDWNMPYSHKSSFQEPMMLFSFLAGVTSALAFMPGVIILPQRQTTLFAKQAANLDIYCSGRLRLGMGIGWNKVEYDALNEKFSNRAKRMEEQIEFLRHCWTEETFIYKKDFHNMDDGGIRPLPLQQPIPIWIGGYSEAAMKRAARIGDGWLPYALPGENAESTMALFKDMLNDEGRDPASVPVENIIFMGSALGDPVRPVAMAVEEALQWKSAGAAGVSFDTMSSNFVNMDEHIAALEQFIKAVKD
ncbi:MAG: putative F420-dependent oxidoreductase [Planctomycetota bacterium]|jgi:probable F420-dependent oxidoreductase